MNNANQTQNNQQYTPQGAPQLPVSNQPMAPFGVAKPYANLPQKAVQQQPTSIAVNTEAGPMQISQRESGPRPIDQVAEARRTPENTAEGLKGIERKELKQAYPQNQQSQQQSGQRQPANQLNLQTAVKPQPGPKFYGYMVAPQIANNYPLITDQKGKGNPSKSRTWIYMLLDRILKKQTLLKR